MHSADGQEIKVGDTVVIHAADSGVVVACFDTRAFSDTCSEAEWGNLTSGVMIDTDFAGLVHYDDDPVTAVRLAARGKAP